MANRVAFLPRYEFSFNAGVNSLNTALLALNSTAYSDSLCPNRPHSKQLNTAIYAYLNHSRTLQIQVQTIYEFN